MLIYLKMDLFFSLNEKARTALECELIPLKQSFAELMMWEMSNLRQLRGDKFWMVI